MLDYYHINLLKILGFKTDFQNSKQNFHNKPTASFGDRNQRTHQQPSVSRPTDKELDSKSRSRSSKTPVIGITITETVQGGPQRTGI